MRVESVRIEESGAKPVRQVNVWASGGWSHRRDDEPAVAFSDKAGPVDTAAQGFLFNLIDGRFRGLLPIETILREGQLRGQEQRGDTLHSKVVPAFGGDGTVVYSVALRTAPTPEMESLEIEIFTGEPRACMTRQVFRVQAWKDYGGVRLPESAELKAWQSSISTDEVQGAADIVTTYRRTAFRLLDPTEDLSQEFLTPLPHGTKVYDARQGMSYEIGRDYLFIDGTMYQLQEPLQAPPGDSLSDLLRTAKRRIENASAGPGERLSGGGGSNEGQQSSTRGLTQIVIVGMGIALLIASSVLLLRRWIRPASTP
jgi:hypothetical protein